MSRLSSRSLRASALLCLCCAAAGCAEDLKLDASDAEPAEPVETEPMGDSAFMTRVDASADDDWIYFSFVSMGQVIPLDAANNPDWDLGFQRFHIISNGGVSGTAGAAVAILPDQTFEGVVEPPVDGYIADQPDSDDTDMIVDTAFEDGDGWYDYDDMTNRLSPRPIVYVVQTARGAHYKLSILDYYDAAGSSGHPSFTWAEL